MVFGAFAVTVPLAAALYTSWPPLPPLGKAMFAVQT
jgi:hypothetical protein